jgi:hypothetical protein
MNAMFSVSGQTPLSLFFSHETHGLKMLVLFLDVSI